jgi:hypothetical protein
MLGALLLELEPEELSFESVSADALLLLVVSEAVALLDEVADAVDDAVDVSVSVSALAADGVATVIC